MIEASKEDVHCKGSPLSYAWGKVRDHDTFILFDPGSTHNFISLELATKLGVQDFEMGDAMKADGAFIGQDVSVTTLIGKLRLHIQGYVDKEDFFISPLKHEDVILGAPWFDRLAASIKFPERKISFKFREKDMYINAQESSSTIPLVNDQAFDKSIKSSVFAYMIFVEGSLNGVNETQVNENGMQGDLELSNFLNQFQDVFIDDIPRELPPKRGDEDHMIELIPGSSPPNKPPYRVSQAQQEEIMRQVNELVEKGMPTCSSSSSGITCTHAADELNSDDSDADDIASSDKDKEASISFNSMWTDSKHSSYLDFMEQNFVRDLYKREYCALDVCGQPSQRRPHVDESYDPDSAESRTPVAFGPLEFKVWENGNWTWRVDSKLKVQPWTLLSNPWVKHFWTGASCKSDMSNTTFSKTGHNDPLSLGCNTSDTQGSRGLEIGSSIGREGPYSKPEATYGVPKTFVQGDSSLRKRAAQADNEQATSVRRRARFGLDEGSMTIGVFGELVRGSYVRIDQEFTSLKNNPIIEVEVLDKDLNLVMVITIREQCNLLQLRQDIEEEEETVDKDV
ncbi:hypothetical protein L7F22_000603 [Adiantum nelumboides]|nr:hypothetical protein [Adiantum nelumboides]